MDVGESRADVVILGTSPILLFEAVLLARMGRRVTMLDAGEGLGGAWQQINGFGEVGDVEGACHLLENYRGFAAFVQDELGMPLEPFEPAPLVVHGEQVHRYDARRLVLSRMARILAKLPIAAAVRGVETLTFGIWRLPRLANYRFGKNLTELRRLARHPLGSRRSRQHHYPIGGAPGMMRWFLDELAAHGGTVMSRAVTGVEVGGQGTARIVFADGSALCADELVISESTGLERLRIDGVDHHLGTTVESYPHVLMEVRGTGARLCSYVHTPDDPDLVRVADITGYCALPQGHPADRRLLLFELRPTCRLIPEQILSRCQKLGVFAKSVRMLRHEYVAFTNRRSNQPFHDLVPAAWRDRVRVLRSRGDLAAAVLAQRPRWRQMLREAASRRAVWLRDSDAGKPVVLPAMPPQAKVQSGELVGSGADRAGRQ